MDSFNVSFVFKYGVTPSGQRAVPVFNALEQQVVLSGVVTDLSSEQLEQSLPDELYTELCEVLRERGIVPEGSDVHLQNLRVESMELSESR